MLWVMADCSMLDVLVGGVQPGFGGRGVRFGGTQRGLLRLHVGLRLHVLDFGQQLALVDVVAFLHQDLGQLAHRVGADVDVILGLNLAGSGHLAGQEIRADYLAGLHGDNASLAVNSAGVDANRRNHHDATTVMMIFHLRFTTQNLPFL